MKFMHSNEMLVAGQQKASANHVKQELLTFYNVYKILYICVN